MAYIGISPSNGVRRVHTYTATAGQTNFSGASNEGVTLAYRDGTFTDVYQNGVLLGTADYTATSGTSIVLTQAASADDIIVVIVYDVFGVADTVSKADGGTFDGAVTFASGVSGSLTVANGITLSDGNLTVASGHGIDFSNTTGSASGSASALFDDYEEGTWTPTFLGDASTASASTQTGSYVKIGGYVWASFHFVGTFPNSSNGSSTGIGGLPFSIVSDTTAYFGNSLGHLQNIDYSSSFDYATLRSRGGDDRAKLIRNRRGNTDGFPESLVKNDNLNLSGTIFYKTA